MTNDLAMDLGDQVWSHARTDVLGLGYDEAPFSPYEGDSEVQKASALAQLTGIAAFRAALDRHERMVTYQAKQAGATFTEMAEAVGISRQAARKRFA